MKMSGGVVFFLLCLSLGACREAKPAFEDGDSQKRVLRNRVQTISIRFQEEALFLERSDDQSWKLTAPVSAAADLGAVKNLLSEIESTSFSQAISPAPSEARLSEMGLNPPRIELKIGMTSPLQEEVILLGHENPFDGSVYAQKQGISGVYSLPGSLHWAVTRGILGYRDKTLFAFDESQLTSIRFQRPQPFSIVRQTGGEWNVVGNQSRPANNAFIQRFLQGLKKEKAKRFIADDLKDFDATGQLVPEGEFHLSFQTAPPTHVRLFTNGITRIEDVAGKRVVETSPGFLEVTSRKREDFEDNRLLLFDVSAVAVIEVRWADGSAFTARRVAERLKTRTWEITNPQSGRAADARISAFLWQMSHLTALDEKPAPRNFHAETEVRLFSASKRQLAHIELGHDSRTDGDSRLIRIHGRDVHRVNATTMKAWPKASTEWFSAPNRDGGN